MPCKEAKATQPQGLSETSRDMNEPLANTKAVVATTPDVVAALRVAAAAFVRGLTRLISVCVAWFPRGPMLLQLKGGEKEFSRLYEVGERIGKGSFGEVFACRRLGSIALQLAGSTPLCVKVVPVVGRHGTARAAKMSEEEKLDFFSRMARLDHFNIVYYHRFIESSDTLYVVMDRCEGPELLEHVDACGGLLSMDQIQALAGQMLGALAAVHALRMMHRDVKPENFRFHDTGATTLKLLDFGSAKLCSDGPSGEMHSVTGTLLYVAPEVFDGLYWYACDAWSVGIVLFLLISGQLPFETSDLTMLRSMHRDPVLTGDSLFRGARWKQVPPAAQDIVRRLLAVDPTARLSTKDGTTHGWITGDSSCCNALVPLKRSNSSKNSLVNMKRSFFVWDLAAECAGEDGDGTPVGSPLAPQLSPAGSLTPLCRATALKGE